MIKQLVHFFLLVISLAECSNTAQGQSPALSNRIVFSEADSLNLNLRRTGTRVTSKNVVAFFPNDSLSLEWMQKIADTIAYGVDAVAHLVNAPLPWMVHEASTTYTFYFRPGKFIAHASMEGYVAIPFWRIKNGTAPWLHELVHEMLKSKSGDWVHSGMSREESGKKIALWLIEGLAEYIALAVSLERRWPKYDPHSSSFATNVDSLFLADLKGEKGPYVVSYIGRDGVVRELFSADRRLYAPAFYHGSTSFVKYIARTYGLTTLLTGIGAFAKEQQTLEQLTGKPLHIVKNEWLAQLRKGD